MAINEVTVTGRKFRKLVDETAKLWQRISFWTKASDVEFEDGKNAETKLGMINGITSDISGESENIAASIKVVNELNNKLGGFEPVLDATGKITGYKTDVGGADTVFPFNQIETNLPGTITVTLYGQKESIGEASFTGLPATLYPYITKSGSFNVKMGGASGTPLVNGKQANKGLSLYMQAAYGQGVTTVVYSRT